MKHRLAISIALAVVGLCGLANSASAATIWRLNLHHQQTYFPPGGNGQYWAEVINVGDTSSAGPIKLTLSLPPGLTRKRVTRFTGLTGQVDWQCPGAVGDTTIKCESTESIGRHTHSFGLIVEVDVAEGLEGAPVATATVEGGGAVKAASTEEPTEIDPVAAPFGIPAPSFTPDFFEPDEHGLERKAGRHPFAFTVPLDFNTHIPDPVNRPGLPRQSEEIRDLHVDTPPGFVGTTTTVEECTQATFTVEKCPRSSVVGRNTALLFPPASAGGEEEALLVPTNVYNLSHPRGVISDLAFVIGANPVHIKVSLDAANHYAITSEVPSINETLPPYSNELTLWGVPGDQRHDSEACGGVDTSIECSFGAPPKPFLSLPAQCEAENSFRLHHYDSWVHPGVYGPDITYTMPGKITDCDKPRFEPEVEIEPTGKQANTPTGLDVHVKVAQNENPNAPTTPPVKRFTVKLPLGTSFSPSFADGLKGCSLAQMQLGNNEPVQCPDASRIGEVEIHTPLLPKSAEGSMYLAAQHDNPFNSTFALLLVAHDTEERGAIIKIPGKIEVDDQSGQITTVFNDTPQFPFDDLTLKFRSGPRAPLVSPPTCGTQRIGIEVASYAQPQKPVDASNTYQVTEGPNGTPCPPDSAHRAFHPAFSGGTLNPVAGAYSPFLFRLNRSDDEQELSGITTILPPGLVAKIAGIPACPDAAIASISTAEGAGAKEAANSACPAASQIGTISAGLGAGPGPNYFPGKVYLAGPYKGAPLSLAVVAPGLAGPFDLGNVVVRAAIKVDPTTAQVTAVSDPFPTILHGVILRVRDVRLRVDRPSTTINPTNCAPMAVKGQISGISGALFSASNPFQVGDCASLGFKPSLALKLIGGTKRGSHPKLHATLTYPKGGAYANIAKASVALPHSEFLDQAHIGTVCTRVQFAANACPAASVYGSAKAVTPLFGTPLEGTVYLRSSNNPLPDLVVALKGPASQPIEVDLAGRVDSVNGGIRNSFEVVPDAPVSSFSLDLLGGKKGLLVNSTNLCAKVNRANAKFTAQNGKVLDLHPALQNSCSKAKKHKAKKHKAAKRANRERPVASLSTALSWLAGVL